MQTVYDHDEKNRYRYTLGTPSKKCLFVIGVNPSTASDMKLDPTLKNVEAFSKLLGFDSFMMLNLYPQRATFPKDIHQRMNRLEHEKNLEFIKKYARKNITVWAAWGDLITARPWMAEALEDIHETLSPLKPKWIQYDEPTKKGHPKHPSRKKHEDRFRAFDINNYLIELFQ